MREIYIDISKDSGNSITTIQGNNNNKVYKLIVTDNNKRLDLTGKSVKMAYVNAYGNGDIIEGLQITNAVQGEISLPITNTITKQDGNYGCQLAIYNSSGFLEHTGSFSLIVKENLFNKISSGLLKTTTYQKLISILEKSEEMVANLHDAREVNSSLSNNINSGTNLNTNLSGNIIDGNSLNAELTQNKQDATVKNTELNKSLEKTKKYIDGLDGSQNIPQIRMDVTELQNGLKANQSLEYEGYNVTCNNTLEGRTEGMELRGRTLQNIIPNGFNSWKLIHQSFSIENNKINMIGTNGYPSLVYKDFTFKANTIYTLIVNVLRLDDIRQSDWCILRVGEGDGKANVTVANPTTTGLYVTQFTTLENTPVDVQTFLRKEAEGKRVLLSDLIILEGDWTNKEIPQYFEGIKSVGEAEINLCEFTELYGINSTTGADYADDTYCRSSYIPVEPNKTYSISPLKRYIGNAIYGYGKNKNFLGKGVTLQDKYTVGKDTYWIRLENRKSDTSQITQEDLSKIKRVVNKGCILYPYQKPFKYKISTLSTGKNLFDYKENFNENPTNSSNIENVLQDDSIIVKTNRSNNMGRGYIVQVQPNTKYSITLKAISEDGSSSFYGGIYDATNGFDNQHYAITQGRGILTNSFTTRSYTRYIFIELARVSGTQIKVRDIQLNVGESSQYELYQSDKKEILLPIEDGLKGLPNGASDKIYEKDGKVVLEQNVNKITIDGRTNPSIFEQFCNDTTICFYFAVSSPLYGLPAYPQLAFGTGAITDKFIRNGNILSNESFVESFNIVNANPNYIVFRVLKTKIGNDLSRQGIANYMNNNPVTLYYGLPKPVITELSIKDLDLSVFQDVTHIMSTNFMPAELKFKIASNIGSILQQQSKNINDLYRLIDELLVPQLTSNTLDIELLKNK